MRQRIVRPYVEPRKYGIIVLASRPCWSLLRDSGKGRVLVFSHKDSAEQHIRIMRIDHAFVVRVVPTFAGWRRKPK